MRGIDLTLSIRLQLLAMFGLLLVAGASVLVLDEISEFRTRDSLTSLKDQSLNGLRRAMAVSDAYGIDVVDSVFKVRNGLMGWEQAQSVAERAAMRIELHWQELAAMTRTAEQQQLFEQASIARVDADRAVAKLREILFAQDLKALAHFTDVEMYPAIDPLTTRLRYIADLELIAAEARVRADRERVEWVSRVRLGITLVTLLIVGLAGRSVVRNIYRGVESLVKLAEAMRRRQFEVEPSYRPRGELGNVVDSFVDMRKAVRSYENDLQEALERNDAVRRSLAERDLFQRSLLSAARVAIVALDADGRFTHVNPFAEELLGYQADQLVGRRSAVADGEDDGTPRAPRMVDHAELETLAAELSAALGREVKADFSALAPMAQLGWPPREFTMLRRDGSRVPVLLAVSGMRDARGELRGLILVGTDLTAIKRLELELRASERQAQEANAAKSAFLAAMSHEIRTPMIGVTGMVEVLGHTRLDEEQRRALNVIQHSADSLLQIIGDILDFSKIEAGRLDLAPTTLALRRLVTATTYNFMGAASSKGLQLTVEIDDAVAPAHVADPVRIRQILANFISNAVKFTERGAIRVSLRSLGRSEAGERLVLAVADTGIGISEEAQQRLFQPFSQAEAETTRRYGGTGLGLTICQRLAQLMSGTIGLHSAPGVGTTLHFEVTLPIGRVEDVAADEDDAAGGTGFRPRPLPSVEQAERDRSLVLLVDDHPTNRLVIARQLALAGFACVTAEDGEQGLEFWREDRFALVLTDVHMPRLDGYGLTRAIRAEEARAGLARTPILAITAAAMKGEAERCLAAGMDDFLTKPVTIPVLLERLCRWLPHLAGTTAAGSACASAAASLPQVGRPPPIDPVLLAEIGGGDAAVERELLQDYLQATHADLAALHKARDAGEAAAVGREAHKIKGAALLVGAAELAAAAQALESACGEGELQPALALIPDLETAFEHLRLFLEQRYAD